MRIPKFSMTLPKRDSRYLSGDLNASTAGCFSSTRSFTTVRLQQIAMRDHDLQDRGRVTGLMTPGMAASAFPPSGER